MEVLHQLEHRDTCLLMSRVDRRVLRAQDHSNVEHGINRESENTNQSHRDTQLKECGPAGRMSVSQSHMSEALRVLRLTV